MKVFRRTFWDERFSLLAWVVILAIYVLFAVSSYQAFGHSEGLSELMASLPPYMQALFGDLDWGTPAGYINTELLSWLPLLIGFYAGLYAGSALAREIDSHTAESLLAQPVRRRTVVLGKFATMASATLVLHAALYAFLAIFLPVFIKEPAPLAGFFWATAASFATTLAVGTLALFLSSLLSEQRKATVYSSGLILLLYFVNVVGQISTKAEFLSKVNPFGHYHSAAVVKSGAMAWGDVLFLAGFTIVFLGLAIAWFEKRDLA